jgi:hypothetical protein
MAPAYPVLQLINCSCVYIHGLLLNVFCPPSIIAASIFLLMYIFLKRLLYYFCLKRTNNIVLLPMPTGLQYRDSAAADLRMVELFTHIPLMGSRGFGPVYGKVKFLALMLEICLMLWYNFDKKNCYMQVKQILLSFLIDRGLMRGRGLHRLWPLCMIR